MDLNNLLVLFLAVLISGVATGYNHDISLEHTPATDQLLFKLSPRDPESASGAFLTMAVDFNHTNPALKRRVKSNLARMYRETEGAGSPVQAQDETILLGDPSFPVNITKGRLFSPHAGHIQDDNCLSFSIASTANNAPLRTCIRIDDNVNWFNAFELSYQYWPMEKMQIHKRPLTPIEFDNQAIAEPPNMTAFYSVNSPDPADNAPFGRHFCVYAEMAAPYYRTTNGANFLNFTACKYADARAAQMKAVEYFLGKPRDIPDVKMIEHPIWTTWAKYKVDIDENKLLQYAQSIKDHGFKASSAVINTTRFPNMKRTISQLNSLGFRTTMWVHPFVNNNCEPYYTRFKEMDILVNNLTHHYGTQWWNSGPLAAGHFDFSKPEVANWYVNRLKTLQKEIGLDSYKFDAGESSFAPQVPKLNCPEHEHPRCLTKAYVEAASKLGPLIEFRTGTQTQYLPNYIRMLDRNSEWTYHVGLPTLITTLLMMNIAGYPFVMPDMIGGNVYEGTTCSEEMFIRWTQANVFMPILQFSIEPWEYSTKVSVCLFGWSFVMPDMIGGNVYEGTTCSEEMFIRWTQANVFMPILQFSIEPWEYSTKANVFMPILQFSIEPWEYSSKAVEVTRKFVDLHYAYSGVIVDAMKRAVKDGTPVNPPIWWVDPTDPIALACDDQFLLGDSILVAPVITEGATSRQVYLPRGRWRDEADPKHPIITGPKLIPHYPAPLDVLPYFTRL
ncbi:hypothetical protein M8J76_015795 [Diaphorina citri]|nr:hypothetical protein M8J76_015795 [Diaphorina citri]